MRRAIVLLALAGFAACSPKMSAPSCSGDGEAANTAGFAPVVYDDARDTWLRFPGQQRVPAVTVLREDGKEAAVNTSGDPDKGLLRVHGVHPAIVLRDGSRVACLHNRSYDRVGVRPAGDGS